ncbi:hypothetical protein B0H17DRAFT_30085 [Mycena rosella]|uniref:Uncharacterized protein n=1 Tax=Mycena rosella TaxID=1033263 RepID=A0AAD7D840_MYCRO|nr:hypothetical protein B0H17DRAFT_30085 [Mycena rosella]
MDDDVPFTPEEEVILQTFGVRQAIFFSDIAFSNPLRPQYCAKCLQGVWMHIFETDDEALPAAFNFIVHGRTEAQMTSLISGISHCRYLDSPHDEIETELILGFHENAEETQAMTASHPELASPTHFHSLMKMLSIRLLTTLRNTNPIKLAKYKGRQEWPVSLEDIILPSVGAETTVKSLEQWIRHMTIVDPWPIELLGLIAYISRSHQPGYLAFPHLNSDPPSHYPRNMRRRCLISVAAIPGTQNHRSECPIRLAVAFHRYLLPQYLPAIGRCPRGIG